MAKKIKKSITVAFVKFKWGFRAIILKTKISFSKALALVILLLLGAFIFFAYRHWGEIDTHLIGLDKSIIASFFAAIGATIAGISAITFSFSLFSIQQAADKNTPTILKSFAKDKINALIFATIALFSVSAFAFAILPIKPNLTAGFIITVLFFLAVTFLLLNTQHRHTVKLINPHEQINRLFRESIKHLRRIDCYVNDMVEIGAIKHCPDDETKYDEKTSKNLLKAGLYIRLPLMRGNGQKQSL